jgi:hypothetical protein
MWYRLPGMRTDYACVGGIRLLDRDGGCTCRRRIELWERTWIEVRSAHFVIISTISEKQSVGLERFRTAVRMVTNIGRFEERIATKVYVLPYAVEELGFTGNLKGYFLARMRANYAAVIPAVGVELDDVLKHEYVHFLVHNRDTLSYPTWFNEGFAQVLQTLSARGDRIDYGQPSRLRMAWLDDKTSWIRSPNFSM